MGGDVSERPKVQLSKSCVALSTVGSNPTVTAGLEEAGMSSSPRIPNNSPLAETNSDFAAPPKVLNSRSKPLSDLYLWTPMQTLRRQTDVRLSLLGVVLRKRQVLYL